jgi:hypothetical protein
VADFLHYVVPRSRHHLRIAGGKIRAANLKTKSGVSVRFVFCVKDFLCFPSVFCPERLLLSGLPVVAPKDIPSSKHAVSHSHNFCCYELKGTEEPSVTVLSECWRRLAHTGQGQFFAEVFADSRLENPSIS